MVSYISPDSGYVLYTELYFIAEVQALTYYPVTYYNRQSYTIAGLHNGYFAIYVYTSSVGNGFNVIKLS